MTDRDRALGTTLEVIAAAAARAPADEGGRRRTLAEIRDAAARALADARDEGSLTERQREVLAFIRGHIQGRGYPPTLRDLCIAFRLHSTTGARCHILALQKKGFLRFNPKIARSIVPIP